MCEKNEFEQIVGQCMELVTSCLYYEKQMVPKKGTWVKLCGMGRRDHKNRENIYDGEFIWI